MTRSVRSSIHRFLVAAMLAVGALVPATYSSASGQDPSPDAQESPEDGAAAFRRAVRQLLVAERPEDALARVDLALGVHPEDAGLHALRGEAEFALERYSEAVAAFARAVELDPSLAGRVFNHGRALQELDRHEEAIAVFEAMRREETVHQRVRGEFGRGLSLEALGDPERAATAYRAALALDADFHRARYRLGVLELADGELAEAEAAFAAVLRADPLHHGAAYNRALALARLGRDEESEAAWERYRAVLGGKQRISLLRERLTGTPEDFDALLELGRVHAELGAPAEAISWFNGAGALRPLDPRPAVGTVAALRALRRPADAERLCRALLERSPPMEELRAPYVELLEARGATEEAARWRREGPGGTESPR